jgi:hypothetical protein
MEFNSGQPDELIHVAIDSIPPIQLSSDQTRPDRPDQIDQFYRIRMIAQFSFRQLFTTICTSHHAVSKSLFF